MSKPCINTVVTPIKPLGVDVSLVNKPSVLEVVNCNKPLSVDVALCNEPLRVVVNNLNISKVAVSMVCGVSYDDTCYVYLQGKLLVFRDGKKLNVKSSKE